ncbi:MAG: TetR/AcrR family transcriptional regulator [Acidimicrobiales bacterium]
MTADVNSVKIARVPLSTPASNTASHPYHHGDLRTALVDVAFETLRSGGAEAVSLRAVAGVVGVSPSAAYNHFPDKNALLVAVGDRGNELFDETMIRAARDVRGDSDAAVVKRFVALGRAYIDFAQDEPHLFRHIFSERCSRNAAVPPLDSPAFLVLLDSLDALATRGLLRSGVRDGLELVAWSCVHGFAVLAAEGILPADERDVLLNSLRRMAIS